MASECPATLSHRSPSSRALSLRSSPPPESFDMVSRQPSVHLVASGMRRPSRLKLLVSKYIMSSARLRRPLSHVAHNPQQEAPPPPPPKDRETSITLSRIDTDEHGTLRHEYGVYSTLLSRYHEPAAEPPRSSTQRPSQPLPPFKFEHPRQLDIATIRKRRDEALKQRQLEEQAAEAQERERQARIKAEKEQLARELQEQETRRRQILSEQLRHAALVRQEREERERQEEAARRRQLEARRAADKERRMRHAQQAQEWMAQRARQQEEEARRRTESRKKIQDERKARSLPVRRSMFSSKVLANFNYSGWITVQSADGVAWRRRWCKLLGNEMVITQDAQTVGKNPMTVVVSSIKQIIEQGDEYADLECVPHSFALEFKDGTKLGIFTDNEEQKEQLISLLLQLTDL